MKNNLLSSIESQPQKVGYVTQFEIFSHISGPNDPRLILNLNSVNLKYKAERELHWCHFAFQYSDQWSVQGISCIILLDSWYKDTRSTSSDSEWINLLRFWIQLLLLFAVASVIRNGFFIFKIFIPFIYFFFTQTWLTSNFTMKAN